MRRHRRFPLLSLLVVLAVGAGIGYMTFLDVDVPAQAWNQVRASLGGLAESLQLISRSLADVTFEDVAPAQDPTPLLVNEDNPLPEDYVPQDLVLMREYCDEDVVYIKGSEIEGNREAVDKLMEMLRAAIEDGLGDWQISAGYRSVAYQQQLWDNRVYEYRQQGLSASEAQSATARYVAVPGSSEHHTGLAFDVTVPGESFPLTEQSKWLAEHCWDYGFIIRYTEEKEDITGISAEPWHVRYVGQPHARIMRDENWCLEEYIASLTTP